MLAIKRLSTTIALIGAVALTSGAPVYAQSAAPAAAAPAAAASPDAAPAAAAPANADAAPAVDAENLKVGGKQAGKLTPIGMFMEAELLVKLVMIGLLICSLGTWALLIIKLMEFSGLKKSSDAFLENFRGAKSINDMGRIAESEEFAGNPLADMAAAAASEVELSRQAGLHVSGEHRDSTIMRAQTAISAVQASLAKRLSGGMQFLASVGSNAPFIGLFAAIPAVVCYNLFQSQISAFGTRSEGFVAELTNAISRQLDKGA